MGYQAGAEGGRLHDRRAPGLLRILMLFPLVLVQTALHAALRNQMHSTYNLCQERGFLYLFLRLNLSLNLSYCPSRILLLQQYAYPRPFALRVHPSQCRC